MRHENDVVKRIWMFDDCTVEEKERKGSWQKTYFDVHVERNGVKGHQYLIPSRYSLKEYRECFDSGRSPMYWFDDGIKDNYFGPRGSPIGYRMKADCEDLADLVRRGKYAGGETSDIGDQFLYTLGDDYLLVIYTSKSFPDEDETDDDVIRTAKSFAVISSDERVPNRWEVDYLFEVE